MPCNDGGVPYPPTRKEILDELTPAILCAVLRSMTPAAVQATFDIVDWRKAGVTKKKAAEWWTLHQKQDLQRDLAEREARLKENTRKKALAKLTEDERKVLGLKK